MDYIVFVEITRMKDIKINVIKVWPKFSLKHDTQILIRFVNFYYYFIQGLNEIITLLTLL